ncbi:MAG TPA: hypothetical protein VKR06_30010 [Ktedonosporobacter sp.]|nr:hypothetical protein [Ktedonosporobacter sp.]
MSQIVVKRERWPGGYGVQGIPLVYPGQEVIPDQPVLRLQPIEHVEPLAAPHLSLPSSSSGERAALIETIPAGLYGRVVDITHRGGVVIESQATVVRGAIGAGRQVAGVLTLWQPVEQGRQAIPPGAILVVPGPLNFTLLHQALSSGVVGIVASSISLRDFEGFLRTDLLQLLNQRDSEGSLKHLPPLTLVVTEGLGIVTMPSHTMNLLSQHRGSIALLSGATSLRRRVFPELVISSPLQAVEQNDSPAPADQTMVPGVQVRVCGGEHAGVLGIITYLYVYQQSFPSGIRARAACLCLDDGSFLTVPLALLEYADW